MRSLILLALCACAAPPVDRDDVRTLLADIVPADAPRAMPVTMGDGTDAPATPISGYALPFGSRTASTSPWLQHWLTRSLVHHTSCWHGEEFRVCWTLNVGKPPGPWPRPAWVVATHRKDQADANANNPRMNLPLPGHPGVALSFLPTMAFECGNSGGIVEHDSSGRVVLRWVPPEAFVGSVWWAQLMWIEPSGSGAKLMTSRAIQWRVGRRP